MPQKIIIVRHGETHYNVERRLQGWTDIPLNENGHAQAELVAVRLRQESVAAIYSSDHKRAHATASHIAKSRGVIPKKRQSLREDRLGIFEGWQWEKEPDPYKEQLWKERDLAHARGDMHWQLEGNESLGDHTRRVEKLIKEVERKHPSGTVVLVTHGGTINRIMEIYGFKQVTDEYIRYQNTSVTVLEQQGDHYVVTLHNDISHLS